MNIIDEEFDEQIEAEARQKLAEALDTLAQKYSQVVKEVARERRRELGQESNYADFFADASAIYELAGNGETLPFPAVGWVISILMGRNPAYDSEHPEPPVWNQWREQWLVLDNKMVNSTIDTIEPVVVASYNDRWEAEGIANTLNERFSKFGSNRFTIVRVPYPIYSNEVYEEALNELEEKSWKTQ